jgi:16S rRNA (cytosine1402-N4)-methyltransferase
MHIPVMLAECLGYLGLVPEGVYVDATAGLGGHSAAIAQQLTTGLLVVSDRDADSLAMARRATEAWADRIRYVHSPFSRLPESLRELGISAVDGLLADLGVSRYQLTSPERGFSIQADGPLDMRMDRSSGISAEELVNGINERDLADLIYQFGEERRSRKIARAIVRARPIRSTGHLARVVESVVPRTGRIHPATQTFQAIRIAVNREMEELDALLEGAPGLVRSGGRIVILTFMSLEDRKVKRSFQDLARSGKAEILTKHVVRPSESEVERNPASRGAKLRAVRLL